MCKYDRFTILATPEYPSDISWQDLNLGPLKHESPPTIAKPRLCIFKCAIPAV